MTQRRILVFFQPGAFPINMVTLIHAYCALETPIVEIQGNEDVYQVTLHKPPTVYQIIIIFT